MSDKARNSIQLVVSDLEVTEAFYGGILQMPIERALTAPGAPEHLVISQDGWSVIFVEESSVIHAHPILENRLTTFPKGIGMTLHLQVDNIEDIYVDLLDEGLEILYPLEIKPYRVFELWCFDPDGYLVVLEQPLAGH